MFSFGRPSSFSVYILLFRLAGLPVGLVFCCFGGGGFGPFEGLDFLIPLDPREDFLGPLVFSDLLDANLERTVLVGAMP